LEKNYLHTRENLSQITKTYGLGRYHLSNLKNIKPNEKTNENSIYSMSKFIDFLISNLKVKPKMIFN